MGCQTCSAHSVDAQRAEVEAAEDRIDAAFGGSMTQRRSTKTVVLDQADMKSAWIDARATWFKKQGGKRSVTVGRDREVRRIPLRDGEVRAMVTQASDDLFGGVALMAFAFDGSAYIAPDTPPEVIRHEVVHDKMHPDSIGWLVGNTGHTDLQTLNRFNESITEHFNSQLDTEPGGMSPFGPTEYTQGPKVVRQLRNERLGGPERGEQVLREWYFGGNAKPLEEQMERGPGGIRGFFDEYKARVDLASNPSPSGEAVSETEDWR